MMDDEMRTVTPDELIEEADLCGQAEEIFDSAWEETEQACAIYSTIPPRKRRRRQSKADLVESGAESSPGSCSPLVARAEDQASRESPTNVPQHTLWDVICCCDYSESRHFLRTASLQDIRMRILKNAEIIYSANGRIVQQFCEEMQFAQTSRTGDDLFEAWRSKYYPLLKYKLESACWSISGDEIRKLVTTACRILRNGTKLESEDLIERQCAFSSLSSSVLSSFVSYYYAWMIFEIHTGLTGIAAQSQRKALASVESMLLIFEYVFVR